MEREASLMLSLECLRSNGSTADALRDALRTAESIISQSASAADSRVTDVYATCDLLHAFRRFVDIARTSGVVPLIHKVNRFVARQCHHN